MANTTHIKTVSIVAQLHWHDVTHKHVHTQQLETTHTNCNRNYKIETRSGVSGDQRTRRACTNADQLFYAHTSPNKTFAPKHNRNFVYFTIDEW